MFYYLGRKCRLAKLYPEPIHDTIAEPFCGSAAYSLHGERWRKNVIISDADPNVADVWRYLLECKTENILELPSMYKGDKLSDHKTLTNAERWLIRYHINPGSSQNSNVCTAFGDKVWNRAKYDIALNLYKVKHWKFKEQSFESCDNIEATWFVDPPYHSSGVFYQTNSVDYSKLSEWCMSRNGQVIACEQDGASWLPFTDLTHSRPTRGGNVRREVVFHRKSNKDCIACGMETQENRMQCNTCKAIHCYSCEHECKKAREV